MLENMQNDMPANLPVDVKSVFTCSKQVYKPSVLSLHIYVDMYYLSHFSIFFNNSTSLHTLKQQENHIDEVCFALNLRGFERKRFTSCELEDMEGGG